VREIQPAARPLFAILYNHGMITPLFINDGPIHRFQMNEDYGFPQFARAQQLHNVLIDNTYIIRPPG
jgi:hypothetical protein